jgi:hypothetical protein
VGKNGQKKQHDSEAGKNTCRDFESPVQPGMVIKSLHLLGTFSFVLATPWKAVQVGSFL